MSTDPSRPSPEKFLSLIRDQQRGRLKVYLGFAPGVGKTYEMLQEGQRLKRQNVDVVIGVVETHGRADTAALIGELEQIPRRKLEYRGVVLEEMDLDAVIRRRPTVCLVDELAHTNSPGSRHAKRYQDVEELLQHGINVITTMNIQHLETLYDVVERFTGVKVKERVPDYVLAQANQIVNVDLPAEDLQERMRAGKIYPVERIDRALGNFFTEPNLNQLREIALEQVAFLLDRRRQERDGTHQANTSERVMVCVSSRSPNSTRLMREGRACSRSAGRSVVCRIYPDASGKQRTCGRRHPAPTGGFIGVGSPVEWHPLHGQRGGSSIRRVKFREGIWHHSYHHGAIAKALVSPLVQPIVDRGGDPRSAGG